MSRCVLSAVCLRGSEGGGGGGPPRRAAAAPTPRGHQDRQVRRARPLPGE